MNILRLEYTNKNIESVQTYFYQKLLDNGNNGVKTWYNQKILKKDMIVIPGIQQKYHWSILVLLNQGCNGEITTH